MHKWSTSRNKLLKQPGMLKYVEMLMQWLSRLFCRQNHQYRHSSTNTTIDATPKRVVPHADTKSNGEFCKNTRDPKINIHDIPDKLNDEDWTRGIVQNVTDQGISKVLGKTREATDKQNSRLLNLPDEILLLIIKHLYEGSDKPSLFAFFVLSQVSQRFRGLMRDRMFMSHIFSDSGCCEWCTGGFRGKWTRLKPARLDLHCFETKIRKAGMDVEGLGVLIRSERICKTCRPEFESRRRLGVSLDCKFAARTDQDWMYCSACEVEHPTLCFSREEILKRSDRVCIARTGYVRMCSHEVFSWDELQASLGYEYGVANTFKKVCKHSSHLFHDDQQRPSATAEGDETHCVLCLSSGFHSREDFNETYFQGDGKNSKSLHRNHILPVGMVQMAQEFEGKRPRVHEEKMAGQRASISVEDCLEDYECHVFRCTRYMIPNASEHNLPGHTWYHAISPESYSYAGPCGVPETCSDPSCRNRYSSGLRYRHTDYGRRYLYDGYTDFERSNPLWRKKRKDDSVI
ncbi:uncharacterized protein FMAN_01889 [Fusarium mangiferae]|uniref:F-box domain-containing protein n=1 Tax=Fusarium mangiferae TaxID=192010 RepID=A0A1L7SP47_FUSMA|nr:uncharacterized protein FMAN_01889 [Fusarium mangiferae]CVK84966.1 uncharacterized protein FMAN_01889 [Fusarium mangiferae]